MIIGFLKAYLHLSSPTIIVTLLAVGVGWLCWRPASRGPRRYLVILACGLWLAAAPIGSRMMMFGLGYGTSSIQAANEAAGADAVVILGGGSRTYSYGLFAVAVPTVSTVLRALEGARVAKLIQARIVIPSGGVSSPALQRKPESEAIRDVLVALGVPPAAIIQESTSRNTRDEALLVGPILHMHSVRRFVLVTSPSHMRRSLGAFRAEGLDPIPSAAPQENDEATVYQWWFPNTDSLRMFDEAAYEYAATIYYWWKGWTSPPRRAQH